MGAPIGVDPRNRKVKESANQLEQQQQQQQQQLLSDFHPAGICPPALERLAEWTGAHGYPPGIEASETSDNELEGVIRNSRGPLDAIL